MTDLSEFSGTRAVAPEHAFDHAALASFMRNHVDGFFGELAVSSSRVGNPTQPFACVRAAKATCFDANRWASCCRQRMPWIASTA